MIADRFSVDGSNSDAVRRPRRPASEIRRPTIFFADLVDSTVLSTRIDPETYRPWLRYREQALRIVNRYGRPSAIPGRRLLGVFGHPRPENASNAPCRRGRHPRGSQTQRTGARRFGSDQCPLRRASRRRLPRHRPGRRGGPPRISLPAFRVWRCRARWSGRAPSNRCCAATSSGGAARAHRQGMRVRPSTSGWSPKPTGRGSRSHSSAVTTKSRCNAFGARPKRAH